MFLIVFHGSQNLCNSGFERKTFEAISTCSSRKKISPSVGGLIENRIRGRLRNRTSLWRCGEKVTRATGGAYVSEPLELNYLKPTPIKADENRFTCSAQMILLKLRDCLWI